MAFCKRVRNVLSDKKITLLIILVVILARCLHLLYLFNSRNDMTYQVLAGQALYEGHGFSLPKIQPDDISAIQYEPLRNWPPGFSLIFVPFYMLFDENYLLACLCISLLSGLALILVGRSILKLFDLPLFLVNIFTIVTGFSLYYFYIKPCTDATAIAFFMIAFYFMLSLIKSDKSYISKTLICSATLLACGSVKYMYIPIVFIIPLFILLKAYIQKRPILKKAGWVCFSLLAIAGISFLIYQNSVVGSVGYIKEPTRGFFPENLASAHPFLLSSFVKPESLVLSFNLTEEQSLRVLRVFRLLHTTLLFALIIYALRKISLRSIKKTLTGEDFFYPAFSISIAIAFLLAVLSLRVGKEFVNTGIFWTYVEEPRYYGLANIFLHLGVFLLYRYRTLKKRMTYAFIFLLVLMLPEMARGFFFAAHRISKLGRETYGWQYEYGFQKFAANLVKKIQNEERSQIILAGSTDWMTLRASLYSKLPIFWDIHLLNDLSRLKTRKAVTLFVIIRKSDANGFDPFITSPKVKYQGSHSEYLFYSVLITPYTIAKNSDN